MLYIKTKLVLSILIIGAFFSCAPQEDQATTENKEEVSKESFTNPIFPGDYPDPSILRDGDDYYIVHSSFEYYPGLTIWHSKDLINWKPVTSALKTYVGSVWAPDLIKHKDKYYIYFPASNTNYVVTANDIAGPWTEPVEIDVPMIDPGHVADEEGNRYLYFNSGSYIQLAEDGLSTVGELQHSYEGWKIPEEWIIECFCMEGPKLCKRGEYYYLTVAEGGTAGPATGHMVISARSKSPLGPWENSPYNPILRAESSEEKWWSVGHATVFDDAKGDWWMIFHGYEKGHYNLGRQTMLTPIEWTEDGWYKMSDNVEIDQPITVPGIAEKDPEHFSLSDDFEGEHLKATWRFFADYDESRFSMDNGALVVKGKGDGIPNCSPLLVMPEDHAYEAIVEMEIEGEALGGIIMFYNDRAYSGLLADSTNILVNLKGWRFTTKENVHKRTVYMKLVNDHDIVNMYYSLDGKDWQKVETSLETSGYHHNALNGFMSMKVGLCAIGKGSVRFKDFKYNKL